MVLLFGFLIGVSSLFSQPFTPSCGVIFEKGVGAEADLISYSTVLKDGCPVELRISPIAKGVGGKVYKLVKNPTKKDKAEGIVIKDLVQTTSLGPCFYTFKGIDVTCQRDAFKK